MRSGRRLPRGARSGLGARGLGAGHWPLVDGMTPWFIATRPFEPDEEFFGWWGCDGLRVPLGGGGFVVPGLWGGGFVAVLYTVIEVQVGSGSQALVVEAG